MILPNLRFLLAATALAAMTFPMSTLAAQAGGGTLTVSSPAFKDGQPIPEEYTAYGKGRSIPLSWSKPPSGARSIAIVMDDPRRPDASSVRPLADLQHPPRR